jgi:hypothetical protein
VLLCASVANPAPTTDPDVFSEQKKRQKPSIYQVSYNFMGVPEANRFAEKIGEISNDETDRIKRSITLILDIEPEHCEE